MKHPKGITTIETILVIAVIVIGAVVAGSFILPKIKQGGEDALDKAITIIKSDVGEVQKATP